MDTAAFSGACNVVIVCGESQLWPVVCVQLVIFFFVFVVLFCFFRMNTTANVVNL